MVEVLEPGTAVSLVTYEVQGLLLNWVRARVRIWVRNPSGMVEAYEYSGEVATTLMRQLNKANLSALSLQRRILERLAADGKLPAGMVTGAPD